MKERIEAFSRLLFLLLIMAMTIQHGPLSAQAPAGSCSEDADIGKALYERAQQIFENATSVAYANIDTDAENLIRPAEGEGYLVRTDCSGFISYLLSTVCPDQYEAVRKREAKCRYPLSRTYQQFFSTLSPEKPSDGWLKVAKVSDLRRGDIIAWKKPGGTGHKSGTGHVMMVEDAPSSPVEEAHGSVTIRYVSIPVIDSSSVWHFKPELFPPKAGQTSRNGLGKGYIRIILDDGDVPVGYWEGTYSLKHKKEIKGPTYTRSISFARAVPVEKK
jgi:hypothetical protein